MSGHYAFDDLRSLKTKINEKAYDLFKEKPGTAPLQVTRIIPDRALNGEKKEANRLIRDRDVWKLSEAVASQQKAIPFQIFTLRQDRSWTTLNTSREIFESLMDVYKIMPTLWKYVFTFGRKSEENEFHFPGFGQRQTSQQATGSATYEYAYMLRRVEPNGRAATEGESEWSIRQTAVYNKLMTSNQETGSNMLHFGSTFLLVAPSENAEWQMAKYLNQRVSEYTGMPSSWNIHRILIADSLRGWMDYMASLEARLKSQSDRIVLATVGCRKENLSPLTDFNLNFEDRQELKIVEDQVLDLEVILPSILDSISGIQEQCNMFLSDVEMREEEHDETRAVIQEFNEYIREVKRNIERAKVLKERAKSTAQLLSDLLSYEELRQTQLESKAMSHLAEKSTKDAAAVKILTVITLIYLPTTIVENFFSTQFVQTDTGSMKVSASAWLLAAIAIPLTILTILTWWLWVHFTKVIPIVDPQQPDNVTLQRQNTFRSLTSTKKKQRKDDLESGLGSSRYPTFPLSTLHSPGVGTWSSTATTVK